MLYVLPGLVTVALLALPAWFLWRALESRHQWLTQALEELRRDLRSVERRLEGKADLILSQVVGRRSADPDPGAINGIKEAIETLAQKLETHPAEGGVNRRAEEREGALEPDRGAETFDGSGPIQLFEEQPDLPGDRALAVLLESRNFREVAWHEMHGTFRQAVELLRQLALAENGLTDLIITPHPDLGEEGENHWKFLVVSHTDPQKASRRFLVPRNFTRYDPLIHDHLFKVSGASGGVDYFVRGLLKCAELVPQGELKSFIPRELVLHRGGFSV